MANYPTSVYVPGTRNTGDIIQASDVNNPNNEIVAIEQDLVNGALRVSLIPNTDITRNIGSASFRWQNFYSSALQILHAANAVNYSTISDAITGQDPVWQGAGTDTFINLQIKPKGNDTTGKGLVQIASDAASTSANHIDLIPQPNGNDVRIHVEAAGGDANRGIIMGLVGTGAFTVGNTAFPVVSFFKVVPVVNAVNYVQTSPAASGAAPILQVQGTDTNIDLAFTPKGTGVIRASVDNTVSLGIAGVRWLHLHLSGMLNVGTTTLPTDNPGGAVFAGRAQTGSGSTVFNRFRMFQSMARVLPASSVTVPNTAYTSIPFATVDYNTDGIWTSGSNTRLTAQIAGKYRITGLINYSGSGIAAANLTGRFLKNGVTGYNVMSGANGIDLTVTGTVVLSLAATDYIELQAFQNSGGAGTNAVSTSFTFFAMEYIGE